MSYRCRTLTRTRVWHQTRQGIVMSVLHSSTQPSFTKFHSIVAKCRAELNTFTNSFVSFTRRQSNQIVHYLAKASRFLNCIHRFGRVSYCVFHHITSEMKQFSLCKKIIIITSYRGGFPGLRKNWSPILILYASDWSKTNSFNWWHEKHHKLMHTKFIMFV